MLFVDKRYSVDVSSNIVIEYTALRPWRSSRSNIFRSFKILRQDWNIIYLVSTLSNRNSSLENSATRKKGKGNWKNGLYWQNACSSCWRRFHGAILAQMTLKKNANFLFFFKGVVDKDLRRNIRLQDDFTTFFASNFIPGLPLWCNFRMYSWWIPSQARESLR